MAQQINLYDPALEYQRDWLALENVVGLAVLLSVLVGTLGYWVRIDLPALSALAASNENQLKAARDQITVLGQRAASRKPDARVEQEVVAKRMLLNARDEVLVTLRQSLGPDAGSSFAAYLQGFSRQTVHGLWLTAFVVDAMSDRIELRGRTIDPALLPEYIRRLNKEPAFQGRTFAALKLDAGKPAAPAGAEKTLSATLLRPPYHEFTLIPASSGGPG